LLWKEASEIIEDYYRYLRSLMFAAFAWISSTRSSALVIWIS